MELTGFKWSWLIMLWRRSVFSFLFFCLEPTVKKNTWMGTISVTVMVIISKCYSEIYLISARILLISVMSKYFLNICQAHWQQHLKDTLQLKILRKWINICANFFFDKYNKTIMGNVPRKLSLVENPEPVLWKKCQLLLYSFFKEKPIF